MVGKYWVIDELRAARIHAKITENFNFAGFAEFARHDVRDEGPGRKSVPAWLAVGTPGLGAGGLNQAEPSPVEGCPRV